MALLLSSCCSSSSSGTSFGLLLGYPYCTHGTTKPPPSAQRSSLRLKLSPPPFHSARPLLVLYRPTRIARHATLPCYLKRRSPARQQPLCCCAARPGSSLWPRVLGMLGAY
ncbi:hypothetical protein NL676_023773 [Syzygium grande]|nr:hypothetical protein NL676_023773 [Syzygium grande]